MDFKNYIKILGRSGIGTPKPESHQILGCLPRLSWLLQNPIIIIISYKEMVNTKNIGVSPDNGLEQLGAGSSYKMTAKSLR